MFGLLGALQPAMTTTAAKSQGSDRFIRCVMLPLPVFGLFFILIAPTADGDLGSAVKHLVGASVLDRFLGEEPLVAVEVAMDLVKGFTGGVAEHLVEPI